MSCNQFLENPQALCLVWGGILLMLLVVIYHLYQTNEHMGEFASELNDQNNNYRISVGEDTTTIDNMEFGKALIQKDRKYQNLTPESFEGRIPSNVDPKEDEYLKLLY